MGGQQLVSVGEYDAAVRAAITTAFSKSVRERFQGTLDEILQEITELAREDKPDVADIRGANVSFGALVATAVQYRIDPEALAEAVDSFIDGSFSASYRAVLGVVQGGRNGTGDVTDVGLAVLAGLCSSVAAVSVEGMTVHAERPVRKAATERRVTPRREDPEGAVVYLPRNILVPNGAYEGFPASFLVDRFGYASHLAAVQQIGKLRREVGGDVLARRGSKSEGCTYDFRRVAHLFIRAKNADKSTATYAPREAVKIVRAVLELEGVAEEHLKRAPEVLRAFDAADISKLKEDNGHYIGFALGRSFVQVVGKYFHGK